MFMVDIPGQSDKHLFRMMYLKLLRDGKEIRPRDLRCIEVENFHFELPPYVRFTNFKARNLNLNYLKKEFLWYLKGDPKDLSICEHAKMWSTLVREDGTINSNYGYYIFGDLHQFNNCISILASDKDSRRASILILQPHHVKDLKSKDVPCTYSINFRIRSEKLNMTVHMRSQDIIYGMSNDIPTFSFIHEMMYVRLKEHYPTLKYGNYFHIVDSMHVYEKHYKMIDQMTDLNAEYTYVDCPPIKDGMEARFLVEHAQGLVDYPNMSIDDLNYIDSFKFYKWLTSYGGSHV